MLLLSLLLLACDPTASSPLDTAGVPSGDGGETTLADGGSSSSTQSYTGPDYQRCIGDAQCEAGSACVEVPGHANLYCAPPCDPGGDGQECQLGEELELGFETRCLDTGRCARTCPEEDAATEGDKPGSLVRAEGDECPQELECVASQDDFLCAGPARGTAGPYGLCTHPQMDGPDCPELHSCYGGSYIGLDVGVCLPWCDTGECPSAPAGTVASPLCYDIGLEHPVCALICIPDSGTCPEDQECIQVYSSIGLCLPEGSQIPDF